MKSTKSYKTTWNLTPLLKDDNDPQIADKITKLEKESYKFINKWRSRKDYLTNPKILKQALDDYERWAALYQEGGDILHYFSLRTSQDQLDPQLKAKFNKVYSITVKIENEIQFFYLRLAKVPLKNQVKFLKDKDLINYKHYLERLFAEAKYLLSEPEEKILNLKSQTSHSNWVKMTSSFLSKEEGKVILENGKKGIQNFSQIQNLLSSKNKKSRDSAAKIFNQILKKNIDVAETELNSILIDKKTNDELRKMSRPDLTRHLADDIDSKTVDTIVSVVSSRFDIPAKFYKLKSQLFKVKKLKYHERNVDYGQIDKKYSYSQAMDLVKKALANLDSEFADIFCKFVENEQIDVYPQKGKRSGAFCSSGLLTHPTYILLNHADKLDNVLTIAHEVGHGINNELMRKSQNALNFGTPLSTAEVASTFMEDFVLQEILKNAGEELKLSIMMMKLNDDIGSIFRQIACYKFEQDLHQNLREKGYLAKEDIGKLFQKHMSSYMGPFVEQSEGAENWWVYWSHIRSFFYVYSYASGLLISKSLQYSIRENPKFIKSVKEFLSAGSSDSPKNIFRRLGIDIANNNFWIKGLQEIESLLFETTTLAKKLDKI